MFVSVFQVAIVLLYEDRVQSMEGRRIQQSTSCGKKKVIFQFEEIQHQEVETMEFKIGHNMENVEEKTLSTNELLLNIFSLLRIVMFQARQIQSMFKDFVKVANKCSQLQKENEQLRKELAQANVKAEMDLEQPHYQLRPRCKNNDGRRNTDSESL